VELESRDPKALVPYPGNPRRNDAAVEAVARSIREFGFRQPIVVDGSDVVVCGHTRLKAALELGLESVPVHVATDLTPEQVRAYRLADNRTGENAEWDDARLAEEFAALQLADVDLTGLGFTAEDIARAEAAVVGKDAPEEFKAVDETLPTDHTCPKCGYKWSGGK